MKAKKFGVLAVGLLSMGVLGGVVAYQNANGEGFFFSKGNATAHQENRTLTITATDIAAAIGEGTSGNFSVGGLNWFVSGASVSGGVATINQGTLYNTDLAGATMTADNWKGTGFTGVTFRDYSVPGGTPAIHAKNGNETLKSYFPDAVAANEKSTSFADAGGMVNRVEIAFGAGGGTSFSSIEYAYSCAEYIPPAHENIELEVTGDSYISAGQIFTYFSVPLGHTGTEIAALGTPTTTLNGIDTSFIEVIVQNADADGFRVYTPVHNAALTSSQFNIEFEWEDAINNITYYATAYYNGGVLETPVRLTGAQSAEVGVAAYQTAVMASYLSGTPTYAFESSDTTVATVANSGALATITPLQTGSTTITVTMTLNAQNYVAQRELTVTEAKVNLFKLVAGNVRSGTSYGEGAILANEYALWTNCDSTATATASAITFNINKGAAHWSSQFFWADPYKSNSRHYHVTALVNASAAGVIRINNNNNVSLNAGDNILDINVNNLGTASLGIFFGNIANDSSYQGTITFTNLRITDVDSDRFDITFNYYDGSSVVLDGCEGQPIYRAPADDSRDGYTFMSWQVSGADVDLASYTFTAATTLTARFEEGAVARHTVSFYNGSTLIAEQDILDGQKIDASSIAPFGRVLDGIYTDAEMTDDFDVDTSITAALTLYVDMHMNPAIPADGTITSTTENGFVYAATGIGSGQAWDREIVFRFPANHNVSAVNYTIEFDYIADASGMHVLLYDNIAGVIGSDNILSSGNGHLSLNYTGGYANDFRLVFQVGSVAKDVNFTLTISNFTHSVN